MVHYEMHRMCSSLSLHLLQVLIFVQAGKPKFASEKSFPFITPVVTSSPADPSGALAAAANAAKMRLLLPADSDTEYSEMKCSAALHPAQAFYLADLPEMYTSKVHRERVNRVRLSLEVL